MCPGGQAVYPLNDDSLDVVGSGNVVGHSLRGVHVRCIIDCDVGALGRKLFAEFGTETSGLLSITLRGCTWCQNQRGSPTETRPSRGRSGRSRSRTSCGRCSVPSLTRSDREMIPRNAQDRRRNCVRGTRLRAGRLWTHPSRNPTHTQPHTAWEPRQMLRFVPAAFAAKRPPPGGLRTPTAVPLATAARGETGVPAGAVGRGC